MHKAARNLLDESVGFDFQHFNDYIERTHPEVLAAFDRAIALAKERGL